MKLKVSMFGKMILFSGMIEFFLLLIVSFSLYSFYLNDKKENLFSLEKLLNDCKTLRLELIVRRDSDFANLYTANIEQIKRNLLNYDSLSVALFNLSEISTLDSMKSVYYELINRYDELFKKFG